MNIVNKNKKKLHKTFLDFFFENITKGYIYDNKDNYKDFISINKFCEIVKKLINVNAVGIFNISLGKRVYLNKIVKWLNKYNPYQNKLLKLPNDYNGECFYLNNSKLREL